jgi:hypothetical protein
MNYRIVHELPRRIRLGCGGYAFSPERAAATEQFLLTLEGVETVRVSSETGSVLLTLEPSQRQAVLDRLGNLDTAVLPEAPGTHTMDGEFQNKVLGIVGRRLFTRYLLPPPLRLACTLFRALGFIQRGLGALGRGGCGHRHDQRLRPCPGSGGRGAAFGGSGGLCRIIRIGRGLISRISGNYRKILVTNSALLALSLTGVISPGTSALLHNVSTFLISAASSRPYLSITNREARAETA